VDDLTVCRGTQLPTCSSLPILKSVAPWDRAKRANHASGSERDDSVNRGDDGDLTLASSRWWDKILEFLVTVSEFTCPLEQGCHGGRIHVQ
jgi:hypothetical protein